MSSFRIFLYKIRAYPLYYVAKFFSKILHVRIPPIPSACAIIVKRKKILAIKLTYRNGYALPGGGIEDDEDFEEGLSREVKEETGLDIVSMKYFGTYYSNKSSVTGVNVTYLTEVKGNLRASEEGTPEWIEPKKLLNNLVYGDNKKAVREYIDGKR